MPNIRLPGLELVPELVIDDAQFQNVLHDPFVTWVRPCLLPVAGSLTDLSVRCDRCVGCATRRLHAYGEHCRRAQGKDCGGEGSDGRPDCRHADEYAGLTKIAARVGATETVPNPADRRQMRKEHKGKAKPQQTRRPGKGAA